MPSGQDSQPVYEDRLVLPSRPDQIEAAERQVLHALHRLGYDRASCFAVRLALAEALANAIVHGNRLNESRQITLTYRIDPASAQIAVEDQGGGFDPGAVPDPTEPENIEIPSGRGIVLMRAYMTEVSFIPPGNRVVMTYRRPAA